MKITLTDVKGTILDIKKDKRTEVFNWGEDNSHPTLIETLINGSVTAKSCTSKVAKAIYGKSFGEVGEIVVNSKGQTLNEILRIVAKEYAKHRIAYIHVSYNADLEISSLSVPPSKNVRVGKDDDLGYSGKYIIYNNWDKLKERKIEETDFRYIDIFNPHKKVITAQIAHAKGIQNYKGQLLAITDDPNSVYPLSALQPVLSEALLESNSQTFRARGTTNGFLNTKLMIVKPFQGEDERNSFKKRLNDLQGADNSGRVLLLESSSATEDLKDAVKLEDLSSAINDKLFEYSDTQARKNIAIAFEVPMCLIDETLSSTVFGTSGEAIREAKKLLWENQEETRDLVESAFKKIIKNFHAEIGELKIIDPFQEPIKKEVA